MGSLAWKHVCEARFNGAWYILGARDVLLVPATNIVTVVIYK